MRSHTALFLLLAGSSLWSVGCAARGNTPRPLAPDFADGEREPAPAPESQRGAPGSAAEPTPPPRPAVDPGPAPTPTFRGKAIDIEPHVVGWPYRGLHVLAESNTLLYIQDGSPRTLHALPLDGELDFAAGRQLGGVDWNSRSLRLGPELPAERAVLFLGDEDNAEHFDVYKLSLGDGAITRLTDVPYVYGYRLSPDRTRIAYVARYPIEGSPTFRSCLEVVDTAGANRRKLACDTDELTFTWAEPLWSADGHRLWTRMNRESDRKRGQLVRLDTRQRRVVPQVLTEDVTRVAAEPLEPWLSDGFAWLNDESGYRNLWHASVDGQLRAITSFEEDIHSAAVLDEGRALLAVVRRPAESEILVMEPDGTVTGRQLVPSNLHLVGHHGRSAWFEVSGRSQRFGLLRLTLDGQGGFALDALASLPEALVRKLSHCRVERVQVPTFDVDPATGEQRVMHAYLNTPLQEVDGPRLAGIVAFYGGGNHWDTTAQILCQAGVASLSPAVRGSWGFGQAYAALNDGDLGGDEIVDLHHAARFLVQRGYEPGHIGLYGGSHGGFATLRGLTFPPETNGHDDDFAYGWGISFYGFSDIETFWKTCNIPDWVLLEAGDPETEAEKIRDRSPLHHVGKLDAPVLLLHGENDRRVPVAESRQFAAACAEAGKACTYVEFPGQGHGLKGLDNQRRVWAAAFAFLEGVGAP